MTKISIVIPVLNSHRVVRRQLKHFKNMNLPGSIEIILMDDGSFPPLAPILNNHPVKNTRIYPTGDTRPWTQPCAKNTGAQIAEGEYVLITDVDHFFSRELIAEAEGFTGDKMQFLREFAVLTNRGEITQDLNVLLKYGFTKRRFKKRGFNVYRHTNSFLMRKQIFEDIGGYPERLCNLGKHNIYDDNHLYQRYERHAKAGKCAPAVFAENPIYVFPASGLDPLGLFHNLDRTSKKMGYKKTQPVSHEKMMNQRYVGHHTICQQLRDIYQLTDNEDIRYKTRLAMAMAKSMHRKLKAYKLNAIIKKKIDSD